jgi:hypothetical protein
MEIPTGEKQTAHGTTEGTGKREWRSLGERNRQRMYQQREQVGENRDPYRRETDSAYSNSGNRRARMEIPTGEKQTTHVATKGTGE